MLTNTFIHIPYVGESTEKRLWENNIRSWDDFLAVSSNHMPNHNLIQKHIELSKSMYESKDHVFFSNRLLHRYHWRAYPDFKDRCCFLDIETTGLDKKRDDLTVIGLYDGKESKVYINGKNMEKFREDIKKYSFIVSFNGYCFDIPFLQAKFPKINFNQLHVDLRFTMRSLGYTGGLKKIEKTLGIERESDLQGMTGWDAVKLWHRYMRYNDEKALDKLVRYNIEDIENLKTMMELSYEGLKQRCFEEKK
ncbi:ribonuclease H-like domain-containing protein [Candidatus Woesearchaeota archaeon]|nr:ribonuclease H-like domain-containing protein [Candidatus Woesearchaeota archaeon]